MRRRAMRCLRLVVLTALVGVGCGLGSLAASAAPATSMDSPAASKDSRAASKDSRAASKDSSGSKVDENSFGPKVDDELAALAASPSVTSDTELHVIILGKEDQSGNSKLKLRHKLGLIGGESGTVSIAGLLALSHQKGVKYVALDSPMQATSAGAPVAFPNLASLYPTVDGFQAAWDLGYTGAGVGVAVIDSGTTLAADFGSRLTQVTLTGQTTSVDTYGHGSFVTSVVGGASADGRYVGVAPGVSLYGIDALSSTGTVYSSDVIAGLSWVAANAAADNIRVVNISLAETIPSSYLSSALDSAIEQLWRTGVVVVVSAGNLGPDTMLYAPANDPFVITVGATDTQDTATTSDDTVASFSSSGVTQDGFTKPELLAPGRHTVAMLPPGTTLGQRAPAANVIAPGYGMMSGTSFAAPQVAGAVALALQEHADWTPDQVKWALMQTARSVTGATSGALDIAALVRFAGTPALANVGVAPAPLQPGSIITGTPTSSSWNTSGWNTSGWNTSGWNSYTWD